MKNTAYDDKYRDIQYCLVSARSENRWEEKYDLGWTVPLKWYNTDMRFSEIFGIFTFKWLSEHLRFIFTLSTICICSKWLINYQSICLSVFSVVSVSCWQNVEQFEVNDRAQEEFACDGASSFYFLCDATCLSSNLKILARISYQHCCLLILCWFRIQTSAYHFNSIMFRGGLQCLINTLITKTS